MNAEAVARFVTEWIDCWNTNNLPRLLEHYRDDAVFNSPRAKALTGAAEVVGKAALRSYWGAAIARASSRRFVLDYHIWDASRSALVVVYTSQVDGVSTRACEIFHFDVDGLVDRAEALYGATS